jgi:hypothetical protein
MAKKKDFSFSPGVPRLKLKQRSARVPKLKDESDQPPYFIRGIQADSKDEYWVALALGIIEKITGWGWDYQKEVFGGRMRRGGNVVDFLVYTPGRWTILDPMGRYWHTGSREDQSQMKDVARKKNWRLIAWFTDETPTRESVLSFLRRELYV